MKKLSLSVLSIAAVFGVLALTSCGGKGVENAGEDFKIISIEELKEHSSEKKPIKVSFWHSFGHNITKSLDPLIKNFEEDMATKGIYIDVQAEQIGGGYDGLRSRVNMGTKSNSIPTMILGYPDHFADYINSEILLPLDSFISSSDETIGMPDTNDFIESYWAECNMTMKAKGEDKASNHVVAIPFNKSTEIMYYNAEAVDPILKEKGYLDENGRWSKPTWEQLFIVSQELKSKVESPNGLTWKTEDGNEYTSKKTDYPVYIDSEANFFITTSRQWSTKGEDVYTKLNEDGSGTVVFDNATSKRAQNYFIEKANAKLWNIPKKVNQSYGSNLMVNNEAFISIGSTAGVNNNASNKYTLKCTAIPQRSYLEEDVQAVIQQGTNAAILSKNSNNYTRLSAWLLIKYLTNKENTTKFSKETGYLPVRKSAVESDEFQTFLSQEDSIFHGSTAKAINAANSQTNYFYTDPAFSGSSIIRDTVDTMIQSVYCNKKSIDDAISSAYKELKDKDFKCESK